MNKHTPAPWIYEPADSGDESVGMQGYPPSVNYEDEKGNCVLICTIDIPAYTDYSREPVNEWDERIVEIGNAEANALLIAAAPELLEALKDLLKDTIDFSNQMGHVPNALISIQKAYDAVAKAEGK